MTDRRRSLPSWGADALLGLGVTVLVSVVISAGQGGRVDSDAPAYLWAVGLGALMLVRRRYPRIVLAVTGLGLFAYYAIGFPAIGLALPVAAALFSAAETDHLIAAIVTAVTVTVVSVFFRLLEGQEPTFVIGYDLVPHVTLMAAAIAFGDSLRSRRTVQARQREVARLTERQYARDAERRVHAERLAIARDLHDSIGHTVSVISLHTDVAKEALAGERPDPRAATDALDLIRQAATGTMRELRRTVALLRTPGESGRTALLSVRDLSAVTDPAGATGLAVELDIDLPGRLPQTVDAAAYRIVQEALTNVVRHARATRVLVTARLARLDDSDWLRLAVVDNGAGTAHSAGRPSAPEASAHEPGHGIAGMTERARALGGTLTALREPDGFAVRADLPVDHPPDHREGSDQRPATGSGEEHE